jgi:hypothetical protein
MTKLKKFSYREHGIAVEPRQPQPNRLAAPGMRLTFLERGIPWQGARAFPLNWGCTGAKKPPCMDALVRKRAPVNFARMMAALPGVPQCARPDGVPSLQSVVKSSHSGETRRRDAFLSAWRDLSASILCLARWLRPRF